MHNALEARIHLALGEINLPLNADTAEHHFDLAYAYAHELGTSGQPASPLISSSTALSCAFRDGAKDAALARWMAEHPED